MPNKSAISIFLHSISVLLCFLLTACEETTLFPSFVASLPEEHELMDYHSRGDLLNESGAIDIYEEFLGDSTRNIFVGLCAPLYHSNQTSDYQLPTDPFRVALMIDTGDGKPVLDYFANKISEIGNSMVGSGDFRGPIPPIRRLKGQAGNDTFMNSFPEYIDREFSLSFKEFTGHAFYLTDLPAGRVYIWVQTSFDGNRVTQAPFVTDISPISGKINRMDVVLDRMNYFHTL